MSLAVAEEVSRHATAPNQSLTVGPSGMYKSVLAALLLTLLLAGCSQDAHHYNPARQSVLRLAVTTSTRDSGLLESLR